MSATDWAWDPRRPMFGRMTARSGRDDTPEDAPEDGPRGGHRHGPRRGRRRHGPGGAGFGGAGFGGFPFDPRTGFPPWQGRRGRKAARGDIRSAVLALLAEQPMHGYQIIQEIAERTDGVWRPSPGSVYPTLAQLEDEGLVRTEQGDGRRVMHLTDEGTSYVTEHRSELDRVWDSVGGEDDDIFELRSAAGQVMAATMQVMSAGTPAQRAAAQEVLTDTRRKLYAILAE